MKGLNSRLLIMRRLLTICIFLLSFNMLIAQRSDWTIMVYMNADNDLMDALQLNFHEMAEVGSNSDVHIIALVDVLKERGADPDTCFPRIYHIDKNDKPFNRPNIDVVDGEIQNENMGDPKVLEEFITWSRTNYPAKKYMLIFWDHGGGVYLEGDVEKRSRALVKDGHLYNTEVRKSLKKLFGSLKLDVLAFDACWMQMMETAFTFRNTVKYLVGSEDLIPRDGLGYKEFTIALQNNSSMSARKAANLLVEKSYEKNQNDENGNVTFSNINPVHASKVGTAISAFCREVIDNLPEYSNDISDARDSCMVFIDVVDSSSVLNTIDFLFFLKNLKQNLGSGNPLVRKVNAIQKPSNRLIVLKKIGDRRAEIPGRKSYGASGLAIFFPDRLEIFEEDRGIRGWYFDKRSSDRLDFVKFHQWDEFLSEYLEFRNNN